MGCIVSLCASETDLEWCKEIALQRYSWTRMACLAMVGGGILCAVARGQDVTKWPEKQDRPAGFLPVDLVTVAEPGVRHKCRVHAITEDQIVCGIGFARKAVAYKREDVAALIVPPDHSTRTANILYLTAAAGFVAASFFPPATVAVVLLRVGAGGWVALALTNLWDDDDHRDDRVVYQRAGVPLSVTLVK